jgi:hypothetical protein
MYGKAPNLYGSGLFSRQHPDSNWGMEVLQTSALPLGYAAAVSDYSNIFDKMQRLPLAEILFWK